MEISSPASGLARGAMSEGVSPARRTQPWVVAPGPERTSVRPAERLTSTWLSRTARAAHFWEKFSRAAARPLPRHLNRGDRDRRVIACAEKPNARNAATQDVVKQSKEVMHKRVAPLTAAPALWLVVFVPPPHHSRFEVSAAKLIRQNHGERQQRRASEVRDPSNTGTVSLTETDDAQGNRPNGTVT